MGPGINLLRRQIRVIKPMQFQQHLSYPGRMTTSQSQVEFMEMRLSLAIADDDCTKSFFAPTPPFHHILIMHRRGEKETGVTGIIERMKKGLMEALCMHILTEMSSDRVYTIILRDTPNQSGRKAATSFTFAKRGDRSHDYLHLSTYTFIIRQLCIMRLTVLYHT